MAQHFPAGEWVKAPLSVLGGKGGGKGNLAQGQGPHIDKVADALRAAEAFARERL
jgi:alanyl-tRNA synthetase